MPLLKVTKQSKKESVEKQLPIPIKKTPKPKKTRKPNKTCWTCVLIHSHRSNNMHGKNKYLHSTEKNSSYGKQWNTLNFSTRIRQHELHSKRLTIIFHSDICSSKSTFILAASVYCLLTFSQSVSTLLQSICLLGGLYQQNPPVCDLRYSL